MIFTPLPGMQSQCSQPGKLSPLESCDSLLNKSDEETDENIKDSLCLACRLFGVVRLGSRLIIEDAHLNSDTKENPYKMLDFIAIDRFTGGGIVGAKFDALALWKPDFIFKLFLEIRNHGNWVGSGL